MDVAALMPQIITAVAALGGVVLTLIFTGRRETKRTTEQMAFERRKLLNTAIRESCISFLTLLEKVRQLAVDYRQALETGRGDLQALDAARTALVDGIPIAHVELNLVAPHLRPWLHQVINAVVHLNDVVNAGAFDRWRDKYDEMIRSTNELSNAMHALIAGEPLPAIPEAGMPHNKAKTKRDQSRGAERPASKPPTR